MDTHTYQKIYSMLKNSNITAVSADFGVNEDVLMCILSQKMVRNNKALYHKVANNAGTLLERWNSGESFLSLSDEIGLSPVLMSIILLKYTGISQKKVRQMLKNPDISDDERLRKELSEVVKKDSLYSPYSHSMQVERAMMCEEAINNWLLDKDVEFITEDQLKKYGDSKTPDFLLKGPLNIDNIEVRWIESKGLFGDEEEHRRLLDKQFLEYVDFFGTGMVVYWYGFVDSLAEENPKVMVKDSTYFGADNVKYL
jgi:hypothetical protein